MFPVRSVTDVPGLYQHECLTTACNRRPAAAADAGVRHSKGKLGMAFGHLWWARRFRSEFAPQVGALVDALESRTLPAFQNIDEEAQAVANKTWDRFMSGPATGEEDPADFAEAAQEAGVSHYILLDGVRQGIINLFAVALYHAFEQQVMLFHRKEVLGPLDENNESLFSLKEFRTRLLESGIDITTFSSWKAIDELRLVANTVKHAEGGSASALHERRPGLFDPPHLRKYSEISLPSMPHFFQPLVGEDLYVSLEDIKGYRDAIVQFWVDLAKAISGA